MTGLLIAIAFAFISFIGMLLAWADLLKPLLWALWAVWVIVWVSAAFLGFPDLGFVWRCLAVAGVSLLLPVIIGAVVEFRRRRRPRYGMVYR